ncbi:MAG: RnfABCDGE type electron transport complex subunit B [Candidatus Omnitrophica bacterium]|nr:RnfABCDGE type electron transport complex subunit B [Candidatus Omnitrophota bacterium]
MEILIPVLILGALGLFFGLGLAFASRKFAVHVDERLEKIHGLLPGTNCGACGGAGCFGFAEDILSGKLPVDACRLSEEAVKEQIARLLGKKIEKKVKLVASLHCYGGKKVKDKFLYQGIKGCVAANQVLGGQKSCVYGCLGFGDCVRVCPFDAIKISIDGIPIVDENKCKACNKCVLLCPKKLFSLRPITHNVYVACLSHDLGNLTRLVCPVGCIACHKCEQACPADAIHVIDNLAVIDYHKCISCGKCVEACPVKTIRKKE